MYKLVKLIIPYIIQYWQHLCRFIPLETLVNVFLFNISDYKPIDKILLSSFIISACYII